MLTVYWSSSLCSKINWFILHVNILNIVTVIAVKFKLVWNWDTSFVDKDSSTDSSLKICIRMLCSSYCNCNFSLSCAALLSTVHSHNFAFSLVVKIATTTLDSFCLNCREDLNSKTQCFRRSNTQYFFSSSFRVMCNVKAQLLFRILMSSFQNAAHPCWKQVLLTFQKYRCLNCLRC